jgi:hypothetical protein
VEALKADLEVDCEGRSGSRNSEERLMQYSMAASTQAEDDSSYPGPHSPSGGSCACPPVDTCDIIGRTSTSDCTTGHRAFAVRCNTRLSSSSLVKVPR